MTPRPANPPSGSQKVGVVVQMRLDSSRLPRKALLPLGDTSLAGAVLRRLRGVRADVRVLATDDAGAEALAPVAQENGFSVFAGPKEDVLGRYAMVVRAYGLGRVVRATGDNPFVSAMLADVAQDAASAYGADYVGLVGMPTGMGVEVVDACALLEAAAEADSAYDREHVCPFLYCRPERFKSIRPECPPSYRLPEARVTVDTAEDYERAVAIVRELGNEPSDEAVIAWLLSRREGR